MGPTDSAAEVEVEVAAAAEEEENEKVGTEIGPKTTSLTEEEEAAVVDGERNEDRQTSMVEVEGVVVVSCNGDAAGAADMIPFVNVSLCSKNSGGFGDPLKTRKGLYCSCSLFSLFFSVIKND